jgi:hypothetical protein
VGGGVSLLLCHLLRTGKRWFQTHFSDKPITQSCESAACFAGWAVLLSGYQHRGDAVYDQRGEYVGDVRDVATDLLGLESWEASRLFEASNTRPMLALMVKDLVNGDESGEQGEYMDDPEDERFW